MKATPALTALLEEAVAILKRNGYHAYTEIEDDDDLVMYCRSVEHEAGEGFFRVSPQDEPNWCSGWHLMITNPNQGWEHFGMGLQNPAMDLATMLVKIDEEWHPTYHRDLS